MNVADALRATEANPLAQASTVLLQEAVDIAYRGEGKGVGLKRDKRVKRSGLGVGMALLVESVLYEKGLSSDERMARLLAEAQDHLPAGRRDG